MSPQLEAVRQAGREAVDLKSEPWRLGDEHWFGRVRGGSTRTLRQINLRIEEIAAEVGFQALPAEHRAPHMLGLTRQAGMSDDLIAGFREHSVYVGIRGDALRVTPHLHVTDADLDRLREALHSLA